MPDVRVQNEGTLYLFHLLTDTAQEWVDENVQNDAQFFAGSIVVEHRFARELANGMLAAGLEVV